MVIRRSVTASLLVPLCALALFIGSLHAADQKAYEDRFREANRKLDAGDNQGAIEIYNELLEANPEADNVWIVRALAKWRSNDRSGARADIAQAITMSPDNFEGYRVRGDFRFDEKDEQGSLADYDKAILLAEREIVRLKTKRDDAEAAKIARRLPYLLGARGELHVRQGEIAAASADFNRAIGLKPDYASALWLRGQLYEGEGEYASAVADYSRVIELTPKRLEAWSSRAWMRFYMRDFDAAIADGAKALEITPQDGSALRVTGFAQFARGDYAASAKTLGKATGADSGPESAYAMFVRHYAVLRTGGADEQLATSWEKWNDAPWLQALAKFITGQLSEDGLEAAAQVAKNDGELAGQACEMHFYVGLARVHAGDKSTARLRFQSALATNQKGFVEDALSSAELKRL